MNDFIKVDITDTGIGIPNKDVLRIFERFYRVDKARSHELGGTGLGLSVSTIIMQAHKGYLDFRSENGNGAIVEMILPL